MEPSQPDPDVAAKLERERHELLRLADLYQSQRKWSRAAEHYRRALRLGDAPETRVQLGHCLKQLDRFEDALVEYLTAARPPVESSDAMLHAAHMFKNVGFPRQALELFGRLTEMDPVGDGLDAIKEIRNRYRDNAVFSDEVDHREGLPGAIYDVARLKTRNIVVQDGKWFATSARPEILFEKADLPPFGFQFLTIGALGRFEIRCDYGSGYQPYGHFRSKRDACDRLVFCPPDYDMIERMVLHPTNEPGPFTLSFAPILKKTLAQRARDLLQRPKRPTKAMAPEPAYRYLAFAHAHRNHLSDFSRLIDYRPTDLSLESFYPNHNFDLCRTSTRHGIGVVVSMTIDAMPFADDLVRSFAVQGNPSFEVLLLLNGDLGDDEVALIRSHLATHGFKQAEIAHEVGTIDGDVLNRYIARLKSDWVFVMPGRDKLNCHCIDMLHAIVSHVGERARLIYTDESLINARSEAIGAICKSAYNEVLVTERDEFGNAVLLRRDAFLAAPFAATTSLSERYEHTLAFLETIEPEHVVHVPYPLYCRRQSDNPTHANAASATGWRSNAPLEALFPKARQGQGDQPLVSIVIPNKNAPELLATCLHGAQTVNSYPNVEIIVVDNNSDDPRTEAIYRQYESGGGFQVVRDRGDFNFSRLINLGVEQASGDHVLLLNNDIDFPTQGWLEEMVACMSYRQTAVVGPLLLYPNGTIQHAGMIVGLGHGAGHWYVGEDPSSLPLDHRIRFRQNLSAVTGACMLIDRSWFERVGPFDETFFAVSYNDVDFCLRVLQAGGRVVFTPFTHAIHHESATRGKDVAPARFESWLREFLAFRTKWNIESFDDFAFSPWFDRMSQKPLVQPWNRPKAIR